MNAAERRRYSRHLLLPEVGLAGQERLRDARVLCVGAGGLGSPVISYLAAAGVGRIGIVDDDKVDVTNLQRQILYATRDVGRSKAETAAERVHEINPHVAVDVVARRLDATNARALVACYDVVVDGSDSFETRYLVNDACVLEGKANVFASIFRFEAQITVFAAEGRPCYRCLFPQPPPADERPSCAEGGVLGAVAGLAGIWQANEALKLLLAVGTSLRGRLLRIDAAAARTTELRVEADPACVLCGETRTIHDVEPEALPSPARGDDDMRELEIDELDAALARGVILLDIREPHEAVLGLLPHAVHLPFSQLDARMHELDTARTYVVACRVGTRSRAAYRRLRDAGFSRLLHLREGLLAHAARDAAWELI